MTETEIITHCVMSRHLDGFHRCGNPECSTILAAGDYCPKCYPHANILGGGPNRSTPPRDNSLITGALWALCFEVIVAALAFLVLWIWRAL